MSQMFVIPEVAFLWVFFITPVIIVAAMIMGSIIHAIDFSIFLVIIFQEHGLQKRQYGQA